MSRKQHQKDTCGLIYPSDGSIFVSGYLPYRRKETLKNITLIMGQKQQLIWIFHQLNLLFKCIDI